MACLETVKKIYCHNPDTITVFSRVGREKKMNETEGFIAMLPLTRDGTDALFDGRLNTQTPTVEFIAGQHETPASIYVWFIYITPKLSGGIAHMMERVSSRKYRHAPLYCKADNEKAERFFESLGFVMGATLNGHHVPDLMHCPRSVEAVDAGMTLPEPRPTTPYDSYRPEQMNGGIGIKVVHSMDELLKALSIRAATYIAEQEIPYAEDVDRNDFTATHLLGFVGNEPAGCLRIRYFADFAKLERLAVLKQFRHTRLSFELISAGIAFCGKKGYRRLYGHAESELVPLWQRYGFQPRKGDGITYMTDKKYIEGDLELPVTDDCLTAHSGAHTLIQPEGQWSTDKVFCK